MRKRSMKVFRVHTDVNHYQYFLPESEDDIEELWTDGTPKGKKWKVPPLYIYKPKHKVGDFFAFSSDKLIVSARAYDVLGEHLEMAGQLFPFQHKKTTYYFLNVTECINCLDQKKTVFYEDEAPKKYAFHPNRFSESSLFKIPETAKGEVLLVEGNHDPEDELRHLVEKHKLKGAVFEQLWSDGARR
jgi:hypothetical protein